MTKRSGFTLVEVLIATVMLSALLAIAAQVFAATAVQRRAAHQRLLAGEEASNVMEQVAAIPWEDLTSTGVAEIQLSPAAHAALPDATLRIEITDTKVGEPPGRRIAVTVRWKPRAAGPPLQTQLVAWRYQP